MKKYLWLSLVLVFVALAGCSKKPETPAAVVGKTAPDFEVKDLEGRVVKLSDLKGKVVLLNFWATWCPPCREEIPSMMRLNRAMEGKAFQMLAVSQDEGGKQAVEAHFRNSGTSLPAYLDVDQAVGRRYGLTGVPETFIIDKKGVILKKIIGPLDWSDPSVINYLTEAALKN